MSPSFASLYMYTFYILIMTSYGSLLFLLTVEGVDIGEFTQTTKFDDPYQSHAYLGGLEPDQGYTIYISAKTSKGLGEKFNFDAKTANDKRKY